MMKPIDVFRKYVAIKVHFTNDKFDYTKSKGYTKNITENSFYKRNDRYYFEKMANKLADSEVVPFFVSNFIEDKNMWSGDLASFNKSFVNYKNWKARMNNLKMEIREDVSNIGKFLVKHNFSFDDILTAEEGESPILAKMYFQGLIIKETFLYLLLQKQNGLTLFDKFDIIMEADPLWKDESKLLRKYSRFLQDIDWNEIIYSD